MYGNIARKGPLNTEEDRGRILGSGGGHGCRGAETRGKQWDEKSGRKTGSPLPPLNPHSDGDPANWLECLHGSQIRQLGAYITYSYGEGEADGRACACCGGRR